MTAQRREDIDLRLPSAEQEDKELALAFQRGEKGAYQAIYDRYHHRVVSVCRRMLGKPEDAEEAAQEAFLRVYQALNRFNGRYQLGPWVTRIATNVCLDHLRSRARKPSEATSDELLELEIDVSDDDPEAIHLKRFEGRRVRRVLASLPPMHRAAIVLRDFEGLSYEEVAIALGISEVQVKALIHRARKNFKRSWSPLDAAQVFVPSRLVNRFKKAGSSAGEDGVEVARASGPIADVANSAAHMANAASSCSIALQQCGHFVGERMTALATTVIIGSAALGGVAVGRGAEAGAERPPPKTIMVESTVTATKDPRQAASHEKTEATPPSTTSAPAASSETAATGATPPAAPPGQPVPTPTPAPSPTAVPSPTPAASPTSGTAGPSPSPQKTPAEDKPTQVAVGFDRGRAIPSGEPGSNEAFVDCTTTEIRQQLVAPVWDGEVPLPGRLSLQVKASSASLSMLVEKEGREYSYNGGSSSIRVAKSGTKMQVTFSGSYSWNGGSRPSSGNLPDYGRFDASLSLDCSTARVVTESLTFTT